MVSINWGSHRGELKETHAAALQHDHVSPDEEDVVLGVVRETMYGISAEIDRNEQALGPPEELLYEFKDVADRVGHNDAVDEVDFVSRYQAHLETDDAQEAVEEILSLIRNGTDVWLVCYENIDEKFCHRIVLFNYLRRRL